jgi:CBS domain-containing protein
MAVLPQSHDHLNSDSAEKKHLLTSSMEQFYEKNVVCLNPNDTIADAAKLMLENHIGNIVVTDDKDGKNIPVGIITDRDIVLCSTAKDLMPSTQMVKEVMTKNIETAGDHNDINDLVDLMVSRGISRLPIVDSFGELKGILTSKRIFQYFSRGLCELSSLSEKQQVREEKSH